MTRKKKNNSRSFNNVKPEDIVDSFLPSVKEEKAEIENDSSWQDFSQTIKPLENTVKKTTGHKKKKVIDPKPRELEVAPTELTKATNSPPLEVGNITGVDHNSSKKLKKGRLSIEGNLDLHGYSIPEAQLAFRKFILGAYTRNKRCVMVVTGKGSMGAGTIKSSISFWLNEPEMRARILAVTPATSQDGGSGAVYILLKKNKKD